MTNPASIAAVKLARLQQLRELQARANELAAARIAPYLYDPPKFIRDFIDFRGDGGLTPYQDDILSSIPEKKKVAVRSGHGAGKTSTVAFFNIWFVLTREISMWDWKAMVTAGVWRQLTVYAMPEIRHWLRRIQWDKLGREPFNARTELLDLSIKLEHGALSTVASNDAAKIEGAHARSLAYTLDESKIIIPATWDAVEGAFSNAGEDTTSEAFALAVSTPGPPAGRFYEIHKKFPGLEDWHTRHISSAETVAAGRVSQKWIDQRAKQWGKTSALYLSKVDGEFCADDEDATIPLAWIEAAMIRWEEWRDAGSPKVDGPEWNGVDVGRGGDESVIARRMGYVITEIATDRVRDTMAVARKVHALPGRAIVDVIGVGAGVYDRLRELIPHGTRRPVPYAGSGASNLRDRSREYGMYNVRSAAYWHMRELLDPEYDSKICLPRDDLLLSDLTSPHWSVTPGVPPKIKIENKEDVVERLGRSTDRGDAVCMSFYASAMRSPAKISVPQGTLPRTGLSPLA